MQEIKLFIGFTDSKGHYYCILKHSKTLPKRLRKLIDTTRTSSRTIQIRHAPQAKFREPFCTCTTAYRGLIELAPARLEAEALGAHELEARKHHFGVLENERLLHLLNPQEGAKGPCMQRSGANVVRMRNNLIILSESTRVRPIQSQGHILLLTRNSTRDRTAT